MAALIGRHTNEIDKKGRVSAPNTFRDTLSISILDQPVTCKIHSKEIFDRERPRGAMSKIKILQEEASQ